MSEKTIYTVAIELATRVMCRIINEEQTRDNDRATVHMEKLADFTTDVKYSSRFHDFSSQRLIYDNYASVMSDPFIKQTVQTGVAFIIGSVGGFRYGELLKEIALSHSMALVEIQYTDAGGAEYKQTPQEQIVQILERNPWLVFCLLCRHAWFNEKKAEEKV